MGLLDELLIRIVSDSSGVDRGIDESRKKADKLTDSLFDTEKAAQKTSSTLTGFAAKALGALTAALSVGSLISGAIERAGEIKQLTQTADSLGVAVDSLDAFGKAAEQAGGDAQGARDSLTDMAEKIGEAFSDTESGAAKAFKAIGISVTDGSGKAKDAISGFLDLASAVEGMDRSTAVFKIKELGITDNKSVEMILKGRKELERMLAVQKEQGVVTKEVAERAAKLTDTMAALKGSFASAGNGVLDSLIPALTKAFEWLKIVVDWTSDHKDLVIGFFIAVAAVVGTIYLPAMIAAAAATIAATWPLIAIGAAIAVAAAAFALIYDDIMNFIDGNDSFIGQIFEKYPMVEKIVMALIDAYKFMWSILADGAELAKDIVVAEFMLIYDGIKFLIDFLGSAAGGIRGFVDIAIGAFRGMGDVVSSIFAGIVDTVKSSLAFVTAGIDKIKGVVSKVAGVVGIKVGDDETPANENQPARPSGSGQAASDVPMIDAPSYVGDVPIPDNADIARQAMPLANQTLAAASATPMNAISSSAITNTTTKNSETSVQTGDIIVQTQATDAQGISQDIGGSLKGELKGMTAEFATGADR